MTPEYQISLEHEAWRIMTEAKLILNPNFFNQQSDQPKEGIAGNREKMNEFCQQQGFSAWFETSAKDNINIDEAANFLVSKVTYTQ